MSKLNLTPPSIHLSAAGDQLVLSGDWVIAASAALEAELKTCLKNQYAKLTALDVSGISQFDSLGALQLQKLQSQLQQSGQSLAINGLSEKHVALVNLINEEANKPHVKHEPHAKHNWFYVIGELVVSKFLGLFSCLAFFGEIVVTMLRSYLQPRRIQWRAILHAVQETGYEALPIVALMSFLIGIVLAYQLGTELKVYGADIYVVDVTGIAMLREFAPLITAVIIAGRTSTSFAALIGTMKVNEEIDVLNTMGVSPIERLVLPRIFGLLIALPLLVVWADLFGMLGGMVMAKQMLNITYGAFLVRFQLEVAERHYILGLIKTPVFAVIIAGIGCFQGFQVSRSAESVGQKTTKAAVQAIFLIIVADAFFSILFNWMNL